MREYRVRRMVGRAVSARRAWWFEWTNESSVVYAVARSRRVEDNAPYLIAFAELRFLRFLLFKKSGSKVRLRNRLNSVTCCSQQENFNRFEECMSAQKRSVIDRPFDPA